MNRAVKDSSYLRVDQSTKLTDREFLRLRIVQQVSSYREVESSISAQPSSPYYNHNQKQKK